MNEPEEVPEMLLQRPAFVFLAALLAVGSAPAWLPAQVLAPEGYRGYPQLEPPSAFSATARAVEETLRLEDHVRFQQEELERQRLRIEQLERAAAENGPPALDPWQKATGPWLGEDLEPPTLEETAPRIDVGGQYRVMFNSANFGFHPETLSDDQPSQNFFNQRFRTWLTVSPNDEVEGHIQVQMGHILWGENFEFPGANVAPLFPAREDRVGIALRRGYLSYQTDSWGRLRAGIQDWQDSFGQTLASSDWDFNVGGLTWARAFPRLGNMDLLFGAFQLFNGDVTAADSAMLFTWDGDWTGPRGNSLGWSAYYLPDRGGYSYPTAPPYRSAQDVWLGTRGHWLSGPVPLHGFVIYNAGRRDELGEQPAFIHRGWALKGEVGPVALGPGALSFQTLYSTGDRNPDDRRSGEFRTVAQSTRDNFGAQGYWSYLAITSPHGPSDVNDLGVSLQNRGLGLFTVQTKYEYPLFPRLAGVLAVGWLRSDAPNPVSGTSEIGTELANTFTYDFGGGLNLDFGAAVLFTGDFYKPSPAAPRPDDLWMAFSRLQLEF